MDDELISLSVLIEHLSVERWLREHSSSFPKNLHEKMSDGEYRLALVADTWRNGKS